VQFHLKVQMSDQDIDAFIQEITPDEPLSPDVERRLRRKLVELTFVSVEWEGNIQIRQEEYDPPKKPKKKKR
jgi:hypothetical protein